MKKWLVMAIGVMWVFGSSPRLSAQAESPASVSADHGEAGIFADYLHYTPGAANINFVGLGGRVGVNVRPSLALEAEMSYDFAQNYTSTATSNNSSSTTTTFTTTGIRPLTGLFGPKLQIGTGALRAFATGKVGFIDISTTNPNSVSATTFSNSVKGVGGSGTHLALYPGGGIEGFLGPIGLRAEVGDEIFLNNGTYNNLRVTFGPEIRF